MVLFITTSLTFHAIYGYAALFIATIAEGEVSIITAAFAASRGYLDVFLVYIVSVLATLCSDWFWFYIGRRHGSRFIAKKPGIASKAGKVNDLLHRFPVLFLAGYRFLYGFRVAFPLVIGMSGIKIKKFLVYSFAGTAIWAAIMTTAGYLFGGILEVTFKRLENYEIEIMGSILLTGLIAVLIIKYNNKKKYEKDSALRDHKKGIPNKRSGQG